MCEGPSLNSNPQTEPQSLNVNRSPASKQSALEAVIEPVCQAHGVELVEASFLREPGGAVLRVLIDRLRPDGVATEGAEVPGSGVSLADCQAVSRDLSVALDVHQDLTPSGRYRLEVGSPGLDRPLVKRRDFERFKGREVHVTTRLPLSGGAIGDGGRRRFSGVLQGIEGDTVRVADGPVVFEIPLDAIAKANVVHRFT